MEFGKYKNKRNKKSLLALGLAGVMLITTGCSNLDENGVPKRIAISSEMWSMDDYYKFIVED